MEATLLSVVNLFTRVRESDKVSFSELYNEHVDGLYRYVYNRIRNKEQTEEIVQNIFVSIWEKRAKVDINNMSSYLYRAAKNQVLNFFRNKTVRANYEREFYMYLITENTVRPLENYINYQDLLELLESKISGLPAKCQTAFRLSRIENLSIKEIALKMNISTRTVENHITNALREMRPLKKQIYE